VQAGKALHRTGSERCRLMRVVVKIGRLSVHGGGSFAAARFGAELATEIQQRMRGGASGRAFARTPVATGGAAADPGTVHSGAASAEAAAASRVARRLLP